MTAKTPAAISTEIAAFFLDNVTGSITPTNARTTLFDLNDSSISVLASGAATGAIPIWAGSSSVTPLAVGAVGQVLQPIAGLPAWTSSPQFGLPGTTVGSAKLSGSGATSSLTLAAAAAGTSYTNTFPVNGGGFADLILRTDGSGVTSWVNGGQILGDATGAAASSGRVGEIIASNIGPGSNVALASGGAASNLVSISLTAGDWDVSANIAATTAGANLTTFEGGWNTASATLPTRGLNRSFIYNVASGAGVASALSFCTGQDRIALSTTTTLFLIAAIVAPAGGTVGGYGMLEARRAR